MKGDDSVHSDVFESEIRHTPRLDHDNDFEYFGGSTMDALIHSETLRERVRKNQRNDEFLLGNVDRI